MSSDGFFKLGINSFTLKDLILNGLILLLTLKDPCIDILLTLTSYLSTTP